MCGILGFIGSPWRAHVEPAIAALRSRGPDEQSVLNLGEAVFAHTRLAVIDLAGGRQPMQSHNGRYTLVYNGEIYNFPDLRRELEGRGITFATRSDTEVLLHGLVEWGESLLPRLDGMFAFALWDAHERTLLAARDCMGIKPLMYSTEGGGIIFASTLAPFLAMPGFPQRISPEGLRDYLACGTLIPPHTLFENARQLPPAGVLRYDARKNAITTDRYWRIPPADSAADESDALQRVEEGIRISVRRQLVADVPLGAFLSGGIDSSLMVRYMAELSPGRLKTFSMKFEGDSFDESQYALEVARQFDTEHHELNAPKIDGSDLVTAIAALDQPLADPAYIMTYFLSRHAREHVTVAVSGDGGDELFGGYSHHLNTEDRYPQRWWQKPLRASIECGIVTPRLLRRSLYGRELLLYRRGLGYWANRRKQFNSFLEPSFAAQMRLENTMQGWLTVIDELGGRMDRGTIMRADLWTVLSDKFLVKTDRASMAHGLEVRVPFLGLPVLSAALALPPHVHFRGGLKTQLKELARRDLPRGVWDRPKHGFDVPLADFLLGPWREVADGVFFQTATLAPFLDADAIQSLWQKTLSRCRNPRMLLYRLLILLVWTRERAVKV